NLEAAQHPGALLTAGAEGPATGDPVATSDRHGPPAPHHGGAGDDGVGSARVDLVHALVRQPERDELADAAVGDIPADRPGGLGAFLAPHHPIGEHPMLQFRRDLDLVEHLDKLGYDEFWCGEHHSSGWEMIGSPEMFLAAAGERSKRIKLATGVVSLPYHHPFNVAQRMVQLDYMTGGRVIFGSGPGAFASDAHTLGIDPMLLRDRQDEAIGVIRRLMRGE